jgi:RNA polymerase sigma-70 factor (ECF subfamily)
MIACTCPEADLLDLPAAAQGDRQALARLVSAHRTQMQRSISRRIPPDLRGLLDADDVIQETYLTALSSIRALLPAWQGSFCRWLHTIARRRLADLVKSQRRGKRRRSVATASQDCDPLAHVAGTIDSPSTLLDRADWARLLCEALINLPDRQREALRLHYLEGSAIADVAEHFGASAGAGGMLCNRALRRLRKVIYEQTGNDEF